MPHNTVYIAMLKSVGTLRDDDLRSEYIEVGLSSTLKTKW